jgi:hypothetical protein
MPSRNSKRYFEESGTQLKARSPEEYGKIGFEALMRSKIGPRYQDLVNEERIGLTALIGDPKAEYTLSGVNFRQGFANEQEKKIADNFLSPALGEEGLPSGKRIFGIGRPAGANTFAHELRHDAVVNESQNRMLDLVYSSTSLPAYKSNVERIYGFLTDFDYKKANAPLSEKEKFVLEGLGYLLKDEPRIANIDPDRMINKQWLEENIALNKSGAIGGTKNGKNLSDSILQYRAAMPFLNFVGRLEDKKPVKKSIGGNVEKVSYDRKLI